MRTDNARFFDSPVPVLIHIPTVTLYLVLGAFQFVPSLRRGNRGRASWHKLAGRILVPAGLLAALSASPQKGADPLRQRSDPTRPAAVVNCATPPCAAPSR
ncbi:DUF2306 domain-containing protein [Pseudarthrobacter defluvii]|uniref:DUF2306 domain-containing protein n=1 Tax=Pseudarthrobacter defluvii TaxID=410837 RepID=UPI0027D7E6EF|nr:DUF2306 domain-containing protein [Pseudarthrobacter defluvii]